MPRRVSLSLDLLHTFLTLHRLQGDAAAAARTLGINQPSMSKRLGFLQHAGPVLERPWLVREGKTWKLTEEGARVLPAVTEIVQRYEQLQTFVDQAPPGPQVCFACGQQAAATFVQDAVRSYRPQHPGVRLRITTLRGRARIERVANGSLDLAAVSHDEGEIHDVARRLLYTRLLLTDPLALVCAPGTEWGARVEALPAGRVRPRALVGLPLILPDPEASSRRAFDEAVRLQHLPQALDVVLEVGGWATQLAYVAAGLGVGVTSSAAAARAREPGLIVRPLDPKLFPPRQIRLIARRRVGNADQPDLSAEASAFHDALVAATA
jgi:DNA-binding transcriptional LysR family regulator